MARVRRVGLVVPSSNPTIERFLADADVRAVLGLEVVCTRLAVERIDREADGQFAPARITAATDLLADAEVDLTVWAGTSRFWLDDGLPVLSSREAMFAALDDVGAPRVSVLTPYTDDVHEAILATVRSSGRTVAASRALGISRNLDFAAVDPTPHVRALSEHPVMVVCTNVLATTGAGLIVDSIVATLWHAARLTEASSLGYADAFTSLMASRRHHDL
ncbi:Asp/Glu racemase [Pseudofrankia inefficax]|uniref:Asp/Glu racemase n=1 Tax=Pseudofrankia inefficax (strain DSM 45817 / CECT 9037 / DDB 130130 / EuI1c) TaxID=298654 RepID=E3JD23_PSEI1|nr:Asp/Glu racemase [Pseudofrankia inefficax]ADP81162.1 Asp/Glu racemase [Pseudofrankia inefficax]